jgi:uridine kinase
MRPFVVGIGGGTASGKTLIAQAFTARAGALLVSHDRYYRDIEDPETANFDHPDAIETGLLVTHLDLLRAGAIVELPIYDFAVHRRRTDVDRLETMPVIVVEGILVLADATLRARCDLCVYVDVPADIRFIRRLLRDTRERGRTVESVVGQYLASVRPMHEAFVAPSAAWAGLVLDGTSPVEESVGRILERVAQLSAT